MIFLPFRLLFGALFGLLGLAAALAFVPVILVLLLPFVLLKFVFRLTAALVVLPIVFVALAFAALIAGAAVLFALLVPLLPVLLIGLGLWVIMRGSRAASAVPN